MAQMEHREKDEKTIELELKKGDAKFKFSRASKGKHSTNSERYDSEAAQNVERQGRRADVNHGAAIGLVSGGLTGGGVGAAVGAGIGALFGTVVPGPGNVIGTVIGAVIGGVAGAAGTGGAGFGLGAWISKKLHSRKQD